MICRAILPLCLLVFLPAAGSAMVRICNDTPVLQTVALGAEGVDGITTQGWWAIEPGRCEPTELSTSADAKLYILARSPGWSLDDDGTQLCTTSAPFTLHAAQNCDAPGRFARFRSVDLQAVESSIALSDLTRPVTGTEPSEMADPLTMMQGHWVSVDDPEDTMIVSGTERRLRYGTRDLGTETLDIRPDCGTHTATGGPYLHSRDTMTGDETCYTIETIGPDSLVLMHLPRGNLLEYQRKP